MTGRRLRTLWLTTLPSPLFPVRQCISWDVLLLCHSRLGGIRTRNRFFQGCAGCCFGAERNPSDKHSSPKAGGGRRKYYRFPAEYLGRSEVSGEATLECLGVIISDPTASTFTDARYAKVSGGIFRIPDIASMAFGIPDAPRSKRCSSHKEPQDIHGWRSFGYVSSFL